MDPDPTATERVSGGRAVTTETGILEAMAHLHRTGESAAVVYRKGRPVGVVTATALTWACDERHTDVPVAAVMDYVAVPVDANLSARTTVHRFTRAAWDWLLRRQSGIDDRSAASSSN
jgi:hypothetical protein